MKTQELTIPSRDDLVVTVDGNSGKFLFHNGERFVYEGLPPGSRVIYPPPPFEPIQDVDGAIERALEHPLGCDPLSAQLRPGMKVTIAFDDISLPLPPMARPDLRERIINIVLRKLAEKGVDDVHLIAALALHRRMTPAELRERLGANIFNACYPDRLYNYDAEDKEANVLLGATEAGEEVEISRRAAESDLLIYVNINLSSMDGGHKSINTGLSTYRTIRHHHNVRTLMNCKSYMDPPHSALHHSCNRMGKIINEHLNVFHIETTLNTATFPNWLGFLQKQESQWGAWDKINFTVNRVFLDIAPLSLNRKIFQAIRAPYGMTSVQAGRTDEVHEETLRNLFAQQAVPVKGQSDIVIAGMPYLCPYNVNSIMNPILVHCLGNGYMFNLYRGKPLVREGGVLIYLHPLEWKFHPVHHPSYIEFFERVLADTTDTEEIERKYEEEFAHNPQYIDLYRNSYAYHGVHPFYMWYWGCYALKHVSKVIFVNPVSKEAAARMRFDTAASLSDAIEKAKDIVGHSPSITSYHWPPLFVCDVE